MSRRKQKKPQQLISDCDNSTSSENGDTAGEDVQVCVKCCAQFDEPSDFARHKECCSLDNHVVVIVENPEELGKGFQEAIASEDSVSRPVTPNCIETGHKQDAIHQNDRETVMIGAIRHDIGKKGVGPSQRFLIPNGGLIMEGLGGPKVAMAPVSQEAVPGGQTATAPINIPMILEELRVLQQRQIHQMQITEQICQQVLMLGSLSMPTLVQTTSTPDGSPGHKSMPMFSPSTQPQSIPESAKTFSEENTKQPYLHIYNPIGPSFNNRSIPNMKEKLMGGFCEKTSPGSASLPSSPPSQLISPHSIFPPGLPTLPAGLYLGARVLESAPSLLKQKNSEPLRGESQQERASGRHKCRFCAKVFGSDSALQIHLRSHTGERPYKCNICGNRFTTRGNLKVHFHRHREKYPHIQMNPNPVPEHLDYVLSNTGLPYGMSVPPEKAEEETQEKKPLLPPVMATESLNFFSGSSTQGLPSLSKLVLMKAGDGASALKGPIGCPKTKADENTPPGERSETGRMQLSKLVTSLPSWALLASHLKTGTFPFSYAVEPLGYSETSKLQQLVEKIDKQATVPNQCVICLRVLSCPRALRLHYNQHGGERPFKCKICGRAFSTKGNLKAHFVGHKSSLSSKPQNSCPICQKKFTNAVTLQQHIKMHLGGQIPNGDLPEIGGSKTECLEDNSIQEFSDEVSTDEESLVGSESENEKTALVDSEMSSLEGDAATANIKKNGENNITSSETPHLVSCTTKELDTPSENTTESKPDSEISPNSLTNEQVDKESEGCAMESESSKSPENISTKEPGDDSSAEKEVVNEQEMSNKVVECPQEKEGHNCNLCSERLPSSESLEEHAKCHTKDGLFHCLICKQSFLEASVLKKHVLHAHQVHMSTHVWSTTSSRRGRRLSLDNLGPLFSATPVKLQDFLSKEIPTQLVGINPLSFWNQYTAYVTSGPLPASGNITSAAAVISPPALLGLQTAKVGNIPAGEAAEVKEKKNGNVETTSERVIKEEK